jgi:flagellar P-ring protein FlgI
MLRKQICFFCTFLSLGMLQFPAQAASRIKDIAAFEDVRDNQLFGYGLIVGLNGTGDRSQTFFSTQSLANMLERTGITIDPDKVRVKNIAAVMVTATLPPFIRHGSRLDVTVSSLGDAQSLQGGVLIMTGLQAADGQTYVTAQGQVVLAASVRGAEEPLFRLITRPLAEFRMEGWLRKRFPWI